MRRRVAGWSTDLHLSVQPGSVARARDFVHGHLCHHLLAYLADDVELVVSELVTNAMVHAQTPLRVSLHGFEQTLLLEVEDGSEADPVRVVAPLLAPGGRGIAIVHELSRDWGVIARPEGGKSVWAEFALRIVEPGATPPIKPLG